MHNRNRITAPLAALGLALAVTLTGCGASDDSSQRLVDTKGPTQLLRNEAASRVDESLLLSVDKKTDISEGCGLNDPDELKRYWHSGINLNLDTSSAAGAEDTGEKLVASFVEQGWDVSTQSGSEGSTSILDNKDSQQQIRVTVVRDGDGDGVGAAVQIDVYGPCVVTGGPTSDEVKNLSLGR
ncbi:MAG: hypothetical protein ACOH1T_12610 [Microbacteriaceae bacterium]